MAINNIQREIKEDGDKQTSDLLKVEFDFNELNRAVEVARWFESVIIPLLRKVGAPDEIIAGFSIAFATELTEVVIRKYISTTPATDIEKAIEVIDYELPKFIKMDRSSLDINSVLKTWSLMKEILVKGGGKNA